MAPRPSFFEQLELPADERRLCDGREFVGRVCAQFGFSGRAAASIRLAVDEACTNVVKHAYAQQAGQVRILAAAHRGWLEIRVVDQGAPFDGRVDMPQLANLVEQRRKGGLGVLLDAPADGRGALRNHSRRQRMDSAQTLAEARRHLHAAHARAVRGTRGRGVVAVTAAAVAPLWVHEGRERERADLVTLRALAFGLAEAARPVLVHKAEARTRANAFVRGRARFGA